MVDTSQEIVRAGERTQEISLLIRENLSLREKSVKSEI